jgi:hypothetical protein
MVKELHADVRSDGVASGGLPPVATMIICSYDLHGLQMLPFLVLRHGFPMHALQPEKLAPEKSASGRMSPASFEGASRIHSAEERCAPPMALNSGGTT